MPALDWIGKSAVRDHHEEVPFRLLEEHEEKHVGDDETENLLIQGDNLHALKALLPYYAGEVDCVYIDPPYNTGNEDWAYNDNVNSPEINEWLGKTVGKEAEDLSRHDKWLCMMYPRVVLLHKLLSEDGSFWMSIDDNEVHHARRILDEIFGSRNFIASVCWHKRVSPANDATHFSRDHDHILVYAKSEDKLSLNRIPASKKDSEYYSNPDNDLRGLWNSQAYTCAKSAEERPNLYYPIENPNTGEEIWPNRDRVWAYDKQRHEKNKEEGKVYWGKEGTSSKPRFKNFDISPVIPRTVWGSKETGNNQEAKLEIRDILGSDAFPTPKPTKLIEKILQIATDPGDIVLDSFAGSASTGHAVLKKNQKDEGGRQFILVDMEEDVAEDVAHERLKRSVEGYSYEGTEKEILMAEKLTVSSFKKGNKIYAESQKVKERHSDKYDKIRREVDDGMFRLYGQNNIEEQKEGLGGGFRYCTLGAPLVNSDGIVRDEVEYEELARHVFYTETGDTLPQDHEMNPPLVSAKQGMALYLLSGEESSVLTRSLLNDISTNGEIENTVVYGDACRVGESMLKERGVTFRQLPYEVRVS